MKRISFYSWILVLMLNTMLVKSLAACSYAYQYSIFPLGLSDGQLIFLELELERYVNSPAVGGMMPTQRFGPNRGMIETRWKGNLKIKCYHSADSLSLLETLAYVDLSDASYEASLQPYFAKALDRARSYTAFEEAELLETAYCRYDRGCKLFELEADSLALRASLSKENNWQSARFPSVVLHKFENIMQLNFSEIEKVEASARLNFFQAWKPYSARRYQIGDQQIVVYSLGWGQKKGYNKSRDQFWTPNNKTIAEIIEGKDVMMHGQRFDFLQWL